MALQLDLNTSLDDVVGTWHAFLETQRANQLQRHTDHKTGQLSWSRAVEMAHLDINKFLRQYGALREKIVNGLLAVAFQRAARAHGDRMCRACQAQSVGSQKPTSDYDITVFGPQSPTIVAEFYDLFRKLFNAEPGSVFDTNVYGGPNFFQVWRASEFVHLDEASPWKKVFRRVAAAALCQNQNKRLLLKNIVDGSKQHKCAQAERVALRTLCLSPEPKCNTFLTTLQPLKCEKSTRFCHKSASKDTEDFCVANPTNLCTSDRCWALVAFFRFFRDCPSVHHDMLDAFRAATGSISASKQDLESFLALQSELDRDRERATSQPYAETCRSIAEKRDCEETNYYIALIARAESAQRSLFQSIVSGAPLAHQLPKRDVLRYCVSHAAMYGSEMYVTAGAVLHVVVAQQMGIDIPKLLTLDDLYGSFLENSGFALKSVINTKPNGKVPFGVAALINASKYFYRMLDALLRFCEAFEHPKRQKKCDKYQQAVKTAQKANKEARNRKIGSNDLSVQRATKYANAMVRASDLSIRDDWLSTIANERSVFISAFEQWIANRLANFYRQI